MKLMKGIPIGIANVCLLTGMSVHVQAQENPDEQKARDCLSMSRIDQIEVVDDRHIIFHMKGDEKYMNRLPYRCPGLKNNAFLHETSLNSYCDLDTITVIDTTIGMRMGSCPLGEFEPHRGMDD